MTDEAYLKEQRRLARMAWPLVVFWTAEVTFFVSSKFIWPPQRIALTVVLSTLTAATLVWQFFTVRKTWRARKYVRWYVVQTEQPIEGPYRTKG